MRRGLFLCLSSLFWRLPAGDKRLAVCGLCLLATFTVSFVTLGSLCNTSHKADANGIISPWDTSRAPAEALTRNLKSDAVSVKPRLTKPTHHITTVAAGLLSASAEQRRVSLGMRMP